MFEIVQNPISIEICLRCMLNQPMHDITWSTYTKYIGVCTKCLSLVSILCHMLTLQGYKLFKFPGLVEMI